MDVLGQILGAEAIADGSQFELIRITVIDDRALSIQLIEPIAHFPTLLADPIASAISKNPM